MHYSIVFTIRRLWIILAASMAVMFTVLLYFGGEIYQKAPPIPEKVVVEGIDGAEGLPQVTVYERQHIQRGQNIWQVIGGMQRGSVWGHGSYLAPDWSADWLHREAKALLNIYSHRQHNKGFDDISQTEQEVLIAQKKMGTIYLAPQEKPLKYRA